MECQIPTWAFWIVVVCSTVGGITLGDWLGKLLAIIVWEREDESSEE